MTGNNLTTDDEEAMDAIAVTLGFLLSVRAIEDDQLEWIRSAKGLAAIEQLRLRQAQQQERREA
jgi:hypothetical protein